MSDETQTTYYGYPGDETPDTNSSNGIGDRDNQLSATEEHHSVALTQAERLARFGVTGKSTGQPFEYLGKTYYDEDTAPESNRRVDIYSPNGPGVDHGVEYQQASQHAPDWAMSDDQIREKYLGFLPTYYEKPAAEKQPEAEEKKPSVSPLDTLKQAHPELAKDSDDDILKKVIQPAFPHVPIDKLEVYARDPNGAKLLKEEESRTLTPLEKFKQSYPEVAKGKTDDQLEHWIFDNQNPDIPFDRFKEKLNPPKPSTNAVTLSLLSGVEGATGKMERYPKDAANVLETLYKAAGLYGWEQSASEWLKKNVPGYAGADDYYRSFVNGLNERGKEWQKQSAQANADIPKDLGSQTIGVLGEVIGATPDIALSFGLGSTTRIAALWGMTYEGTSAYGEAIEEHQKNALQSGATAATMRGFGQYLMNTGMGRVASGFANAVASASEEELQKWLRGEPNDITQDGKSFLTGLVTGLFMGGKKAKAEYRAPEPSDPQYSYAGAEDTGANTATFTFHHDPAVNEEVTKAVEHHQQGNVNEAHDHLDRAIAVMSDDDRAKLTKQVIAKVDELGSIGKVIKFPTESWSTPEEGGYVPDPDANKPGRKLSNKDIKEFFSNVSIPEEEIERGHHLDVVREEGEKDPNDPFNDYFFSGVPLDPEDLDAMLGEAPKLLGHEQIREEGVEFHAGLPIPKGFDKGMKRAGANWNEMFAPEKYGGENSELAGAIVKSEKGRSVGMRTMAQSEIARQAGIESMLKGGTESANRERYFNKFSTVERVQHFVDYQEGRPLADPIAHWIYHNVYGPMHESLARRDESYHILYDERENYFMQALSHPKDDLPRLLEDIRRATGGQSFIKPRQMTLATRLALGHEMLTDNPERLLQMRWASSDRAIEKIRVMRELVDQGLAYRTDDPNAPYQAKAEWAQQPTLESYIDAKGEVHKANYYVNPDIVPVLNNAFDMRSVHRAGFLTQMYFRVMNTLKGLAGIKLQWSLFHPLHIAQIAGADIATEAQRRWGLGVGNSGDRTNALTAMLPAMGIWHVIDGYKKMGDEINVLKGRVPWSAATATVRENIKMFMDMGLSADTNHERQMMFHQFITDQLPKNIRDVYRNDPRGASATRAGYRALSGEWFSRWWFGELTPRIKMASAVMRRDTLMRTNPDLFKPQNRAELLKEYQKIGRDIEGRYGEMNYDTLLWTRMAKEIGTAHLLALGWQVGLMRTSGDAIVDMSRNAAHMAKITKNPGPGWSNRMMFGINYNTAQLMTGAAITYMFTKTIPTLWDMIFPRVGKDDKGNDKRVQMQGFMKEFPSVANYIGATGSGAGGLTQWAKNKINPAISAVVQAIYNRNYMDQPIGNWQDTLKYWFQQTFEPISAVNAEQTLKEEGTIGDYIMDVLGFTPSGRWTNRSAVENEMIRRWSDTRKGTQEVTEARDAYRRAYNSGSTKAMEDAKAKLNEEYQKVFHKPVTERILKNIQNNAHKSTGQIILKELSHEDQIMYLKKMSEDERAKFLPDASPEVQREFQGQ